MVRELSLSDKKVNMDFPMVTIELFNILKNKNKT